MQVYLAAWTYFTSSQVSKTLCTSLSKSASIFFWMQLKDKIIVFSDNIFALREYAVRMKRPMIYGGTSHNERTRILSKFKHSPDVGSHVLVLHYVLVRDRVSDTRLL